jgi:class 3 adenylate cyclase
VGVVILVFSGFHNYIYGSYIRDNYLETDKTDVEFLSKPVHEPNSQRRLEIIGRIFYPQIARFLKNPTDKRAEKGWSLPEKSCLYIVRRGRVQKRIGFNPEKLLPPDWESHFFLGLYNGGSVFESKSGYFYPRPIKYDNFMQFSDSFRPLHIAGERLVFYFTTEGNYTFFFILHSSTVSNADLLPFLKQNDNTDWLENNYNFYLQSMGLFLIFLAFMVGFFQSRESFFRRLLCVCIVLFGISDFFFCKWFTGYVDGQKTALEKKFRDDFQLLLNSFEEGFNDFLKQEAGKIVDLYFRENDLSSERWSSKLFRLQADMDGIKKFLPSNNDWALAGIAGLILPDIISNHPLLLEGVRSYNREELEQAFDSPEVNKIRSLVKVSYSGGGEKAGGYRKDLSGQFYFYPLFEGGYYWLWIYDENRENPGVFLAIYESSELIFSYLNQVLGDMETGVVITDDLRHFRLLSREHFGLKRVASSAHADCPMRERREIFGVLAGQILRQVCFELNGYDWFGIAGESELLQNYLAGLMPAAELYAPLKKLWWQFWLVQLFFILLMQFTFFLLHKVLLKPLSALFSGFQDLLNGNYEVNIPGGMADERGVCLQSFNFMAGELREREKLLPFVADQVLRLFSVEDGGFSDCVQGQACVLFSDIRSFTTISEQHEPEKVVEMLNDYFTIWQSVVEKYDGIIERFIGDAVVVIFFRRFSENYVSDAVNAAYDLMRELKVFNRQREISGLFTINNGIGIACGEIGFSVLGNEKRRHFFAMGEPVKKAEELEASTKIAEFTRIFVDQSVIEKCACNDFKFVEVAVEKRLEVAGKSEMELVQKLEKEREVEDKLSDVSTKIFELIRVKHVH